MKLEEYKSATLDAMKYLIYKYEHPHEFVNLFFAPEYCPLCKIHKFGNSRICRGCPLANINGAVGCNEFHSFKKAVEAHYRKDFEYYASKRAEFFKKIIPIIEPYSRGYFTYDGWSFFSALNRAW